MMLLLTVAHKRLKALYRRIAPANIRAKLKNDLLQ
jgi:hypothetical protein